MCLLTINYIRLNIHFHHLIPPVASIGGWTQTPDVEMIWRVFYHCATTACHSISQALYFVSIFLKCCPATVANMVKHMTADYKIGGSNLSSTCMDRRRKHKDRHVCWQLTTFDSIIIFNIFSLPLPTVVVRLKPLTLRWWGECSTTVLPLLATEISQVLNFVSRFLKCCSALLAKLAEHMTSVC